MRISLTNPVAVSTEAGDITCTEAEVSVAVSNSAAIRVVPVDAAGAEHPAAAIGVVGTVEQPDIAAFINAVAAAAGDLLTGRGI